MPAESKEQHRFMCLCASKEGRKKAKGECPPMNVAKEYCEAGVKKGKLKKKMKGK